MTIETVLMIMVLAPLILIFIVLAIAFVGSCCRFCKALEDAGPKKW